MIISLMIMAKIGKSLLQNFIVSSQLRHNVSVFYFIKYKNIIIKTFFVLRQ